MPSAPEPSPREYAPSEQARRFRTTGVRGGSKRRMSPWRRAWYALLVAMLRGFLALIWGTCRVTAVRGAEHLDPARREAAPAVIAYWHQMHIWCAWLLRRQARRGLRLAVLTSPSVTGEVPAAVMRRWGIEPLRGSSTRSAGETLRDMYNVVHTRGLSLVVTADGPKGPRHQFKPGAILLARMTRAPVVTLAWAASRCIRWGSWDEFLLPLPFSRVAIVVAEPWLAPPGFAMADVPQATRELEERLAGAAAEAARLLR